MLSRTDRGGRIHSEIIRLTPTELAEIVTQAVVFVFGSERIEGPLQFLAEQAAAEALDRARFVLGDQRPNKINNGEEGGMRLTDRVLEVLMLVDIHFRFIGVRFPLYHSRCGI
jgi:hypothetical protein